LSSLLLLFILSVTLGVLYIRDRDLQSVPELSKTKPVPTNSSIPALSERATAIWALELGCDVYIVFSNRESEKPTPISLDSLPNEDFHVKRITFPIEQNITKNLLNQLAGLKKLYKLTIHDCSIEDDALKAIINLTSLEKLDFHQTGITDKGLSHLVELINLTNLSLQFNQNITDEGLQILNQFEKLESVNLARTNISDKGLNFIQNNPKIRWLNIEATQVSDESVKHLLKLRQLKNLYLNDSRISEEGIKEIRLSFGKNDPLPRLPNGK
ncbi:MAG: hypothetical protein QM501_03555, partial [Gimesia sp.]